MGNTLLIRDFGPGKNPLTVSELQILAAQGANVHLNGNGLEGVTLTVAMVVSDKEAKKIRESKS